MNIIVHDLKNSFPTKISFYEQYIKDLLLIADIRINGGREWDMHVHDKRLYKQLFEKGSLGLGESYMEGLWDCVNVDEFMFRIIQAGLADRVKKSIAAIINKTLSKVFNLQSPNMVYEVAKKHYNTGNDIFAAMLDNRMIYSCAYWNNVNDLDAAQEQKLDLICRKLKLQPGLKLLDIGCGWGGMAQFAAEKYGVEVLGITISKEQAQVARKKCTGLPVEIRLQDYRGMHERFDRIVSVGMFEHVGYKNYGEYIRIVKRALNPDGLFLLHTIGGNESVTQIDPWINKYIFPNAMLPSLSQIGKATEKVLVVEDLHNIGPHYDLTLMAWLQRFKQAWPDLKNKYTDKFYRMWVYYLSCSAACFRAKDSNLWQIVMSLPSSHKTYDSIR